MSERIEPVAWLCRYGPHLDYGLHDIYTERYRAERFADGYESDPAERETVPLYTADQIREMVARVRLSYPRVDDRNHTYDRIFYGGGEVALNALLAQLPEKAP